MSTADSLLENPSGLVFGMGVGVFTIFVFTIILFFVFLFTMHSSKTEKILIRGISTLIFGIIMLILIFAERESRFYYAGYERQIYDSSVIPRIAIACAMMLFSIISAIFCITTSGQSKEISNTDREDTELWQD